MKRLLLRVQQEERASTALTLMWFMVAALLFAIGLDAFLGIYITHQQLRTAGIAAANAVTRAITDEAVLPPAVEKEAARRVAAVKDEAQEEIDDILDLLACDDDDEYCVPLTADDIKRIKIQAYRNAFYDLYHDQLDRDMAEKMVEGTWDQEPAHVKMNKLIPDDGDLACLIRDAAHAKESFIRSEAARLAEANGATLERITLLDNDGWNVVYVSQPVKPFGAAWLFPNADYPKLTVNQLSRIRQFGGGRTPQWSSSC